MAGKVDAVVVSYNVRDLLLECLASLIGSKAAGELARIIVVDNASSDGSAEAAGAFDPAIEVIEAPNDGYGSGANVGIAVSDAEMVMVLNPDTVVRVGAIATLTAWLDAHPDFAIAGPRLVRPDGTTQSSRRTFPRPYTPLFESSIVEEWWPGNPVARDYHLADSADDVDQEVDWVVGAAVLVRKIAIQQVGAFDPSFRMYAEEVEWCWRLRQHGWRTSYVAAAEIVHHESASASQDLPRRLREFDDSRIQLTERLFGATWARLVSIGIRTDYAIRLLRESAKWLLGHRRDLRRARMRFYADALRRGPQRRGGG
ncbi:MAG: glycosyltransferase family 2 protein [Thermomicrobiales bacterium]|nr:glycosyltransferase family 2 protein [Thermomicrobiales bacterium]